MPNFIGLDVGTTTVTGVVLDVERGEVLHQAQRRNDSAVRSTLCTRAEQDSNRLLLLAREVLAELAASGRMVNGGQPVDGIAVTGQKHGLLCVDGQSKALTPLISWQDQRTAELLPDGSTTLDKLHARVIGLTAREPMEVVWQENGCRIVHGYGAATLFWLVQEGKLPAATQRVCTIADWLAGQLAGRFPVTDPTFAASWGLYSLMDNAWNVAFLDRLGLEGRLLPPIRPSVERLGGLVSSVARQVGLPDGIPVFNALGDTQASFLGSVTEPECTVLFNLGTGGQICWMVSQLEPPTETVETRPLPHRRYLRVGASLCGGAAYAWLASTLRAWLAEFGVQLEEGTAYERLNALATECESTEGLHVRTTFLGVRGDPTVRTGAIEGITPDNLRLGALAWATLVGMVDELHDLYVTQSGTAREHTRLIATGGGVRKNPLMPGLIEKRFGLPIQVPRQPETAAMGAAMLAARTD